MFCDLVGSTALSERLDPEDLREVIHAFQEACTEQITRYDGFIARYMGDGMLVYFGYPHAHEDDAERAVRAGLAIVEAVTALDAGPQGRGRGVSLAVRVGIATGPVVAGDLVGHGAAEERAVVGETPNLAARLEGLAEPDTVAIAPTTRQLAGGLFEYRDLGSHHLKGFSEPVRAWRVTGSANVGSRLEALRAAQLLPLVGREEELGLLLERWRLARGGACRVVVVTAEAGIGKSRLCVALQEQLAGPEPVHDAPAMVRYQCSPHHRNTALHPVLEQLRRAAGFERDEEPAVQLDRLERVLAPIAHTSDQIVPLFATLLSVDVGDRVPPLLLGPQQQKEETLAALLRLLDAWCSDRALLLVFEDVHWIDPTSSALLDRIVDWAPTAAVQVVVTTRPEFEPAWVALPHLARLELHKMSPEQSGTLVQEVAGRTLPPEVLRQIVERADGVPLFADELTRAVLDSGHLVEEGDRYALSGTLPSMAIPATLQDSLMARLDRLAWVKGIAQVGAVLGREFSHELLAAVASIPETELRVALERLVASGLLFRTEGPGEAYLFKHALVRDIAYQGLLRARRRELHLQVARALEERLEGGEVEFEEVAHHHTEAGEYRSASHWWHRSGTRAVSRGATTEAIGHFQRGVELLGDLQDSADRARLQVTLQCDLASALRVVDHFDEARDVLADADRSASNHRLYAERADVRHTLGNICFLTGDTEGCQRQHELALEDARAADSWEKEARAYGGLGDAAYARGRMRTAHGHFQHCVALSREHGFAHIEVANRAMVGWSRLYLQEIEEAVEDGLAGAQLASDLGHVRARMVAISLAGVANTELGNLDIAEAQIDESLELAARLGKGSFWTGVLYYKARLLRHTDRKVEARALLAEALEMSRELGGKFVRASIMGAIGREEEDPEASARALAEGERLLRAGCVGHNHLWFYADAIEAALRHHRWDEAVRFADALEDFTREEPLAGPMLQVARARARASDFLDGVH
jgi:predicted ATPase/class 3 adenylate cyclase